MIQMSEPATDIKAALRLLYPPWGSRTERTLHLRDLGEMKAPLIEVALYTSGYTGDCYTESTYHPVTPEIARTLVDNGWVRGTPHWGYTDDKELHITDAGERQHLQNEK